MSADRTKPAAIPPRAGKQAGKGSEIGARVAALRARAGLTQGDVAKRPGMPQQLKHLCEEVELLDRAGAEFDPAAGLACTTTPGCPVCLSCRSRHFLRIDEKDYWRCRKCKATFIDAAHLPSPAAELNRYRQHRNRPDDPAYRRFLDRLAAPLLERIAPGSEGLDFGCGPGPALASMLREAGHCVQLYDPFFHPDVSVLARTYDFITCTETVEHFHHPAAEFETLNRLLRPGGRLGIMTCFQTDDNRFVHWHYRRDSTHVVFYREETLRYVAARFDWECEIPARNVVVMRKHSCALR